MSRALPLLALCQGFLLTNNVGFIAISGLVGVALARWNFPLHRRHGLVRPAA